MAMSDYSLSDIAAVTDGVGGNNGGWGGGGWWILLLFIILGWGGNRGWGGNGNGAGNIGGNELYPWMENQSALCNGFSNVTAAITNGFANAETAATSRQMANMQQMFGLSQQFAQCCCDNQLAMANQTATILAENCADRQAVSDGVRDILANQTAGVQRILDKLCQLELDGSKAETAAANREILNLQNQLNMANFQASQASQNALFQQGLNNEVDALYNRLKNCPVPSMPVYGQQPIFTCNNGCGCGNSTLV